ncbi:uncharacterized protein LOC130691333 [Daphnia carinata]|uniref:uncharacterized protein LOC130691333 n=1 Tax=Daphnia carinata TaxID=120202 RepID=UPI002580BBB8|nr:uncharacterized protein LOC130691333 [Daphnia carinata]
MLSTQADSSGSTATANPVPLLVPNIQESSPTQRERTAVELEGVDTPLLEKKKPIISNGSLFQGYILTNGSLKPQYLAGEPKENANSSTEKKTRVIIKGFYNYDVQVAIVKTLLVHSDQQNKEIEREFRILKELEVHENFIRYFTQEKDLYYVYLATELCLCSVADLLDPPLETKIPMKDDILKIPAKEILRQATNGLNYLHKNHFIHRNIKPNNFLIKEINKTGESSCRFVVKITDFRLSRKYDPQQDLASSGPAASGGWEAPESRDTTKNLSKKLDVFILGCFYYYVLTAWTSDQKPRHPFGDESNRRTNIQDPLYSILKNGFLFATSENIKDMKKAEDLINWMLKFKEDERPTLENVLDNVYFKPSEDYKIYADQGADQDVKPGLCVIFNQQEFEDPKQNREGSDKDEEALKNTFKKLGFDFEVHQNLTSDDLKSEINELANKRDFKNYGCLVVCLLSHGIENAILCYDGKFVNINELKYEFSSYKCPSLYGKPKIFIAQACQGNLIQQEMGRDVLFYSPPTFISKLLSVPRVIYSHLTGTLELSRSLVQLAKEDITASNYKKELLEKKSQDSAQRNPSLMDFLTIKSTLPGFIAYRDPEGGSWFVQALCEVLSDEYLEKEAGTSQKDLTDLLKCVQNEINTNSQEDLWQTMQWEASISKNIRFQKGVTEGTDITMNDRKDMGAFNIEQ